MTVSKRQSSVQHQFTFENKTFDTRQSYIYLGFIISDNGSLKLNINEFCKSTSREMYNLLGNVNKHLSGNVYILTELFDKMILPTCTYDCEIWGASFFPKNFLPADFLSEKQCKNPLDRPHCSFLKYILCVNSTTSNWTVQRKLTELQLPL